MKKKLPKNPGEIAVIRLTDGGLSVVRISKVDTEKYFWFGGPTWAYGGYEVVEYVKETNWEKIELWYLKKYHPVTPSSEIKQSAFWMSPEGLLYYCKYHEHDGLARCISACVYNNLEGVLYLEENNWLRCHDSGLLIYGWEPATLNDAQAETVSKLIQVGNDEWKEHLSYYLRQYQDKTH